MKKMLIIIIVLAVILVGMIIQKNRTINKNTVNVQEVEQIEEYISKIYMWKEVTQEALPLFENVNEANELWIWEVIKKNLDAYEISYKEIEEKGKEILGEKFERQFSKEGNQSFFYDETNDKYLATETSLDEMEDTFLLNNIEKTKDGYIVEIIEYLEDYANENKVIVKNLQEEEIGQVNITNDNKTKIQELVKNNRSRFDKKRVCLKNENNHLIVQKVEKIQE